MFIQICKPGTKSLVGLFLGFGLFLMQLASVLAAPAVIATIPLAVPPFSGVINPVTNRYYITNATSNSVTVIDGTTNTVLTTINTASYGNRPQGLAVETSTNRIYVPNFNSNNVMVIDGNTNTVLTTITGFNGPSSLSVNSTTHRIYVSNYWGNSVSVVDGTSNTILTTVAVGPLPQGAVVNPANNRVYIGCSGSNNYYVLDGNTNTVITTLPNGNLLPDPATNHLYFITGTTISVLDGTTYATLQTANLGYASNWFGTAFNQAKNRVYLVDNSNGKVLAIDATSLAVVNTVGVGTAPAGANFNPNTGHLFILNSGSNSVSVIADLLPPTITKAFGAASIPNNGTTTLSFTISNPNPADALNGLSFTDNLPAGLVVAVTPNATSTCGGTFNALAGSTSVNLSGGVLAANANCTISLNVTGISPGSKANTTQPVSATESGPGTTSNTVILAVDRIPTSLCLTSVPDPSTFGQLVTFTATVSSNSATGTITFTEGVATLGTSTVSNGQAIFTINSFSLGNHLISATYGGDSNYGASISNTVTQVVNQASTNLSLTSAPNPSTFGQSVTFTATVSPITATGTVTFTEGVVTLGTGTLSSGVATFATTGLSVGSHVVSASYSGDNNYAGSTSNTVTQVVNCNPNTSLVTNINDDGTATVCGSFSYALLHSSQGVTITFTLTQSNTITFTGPLTTAVPSGVIINGGNGAGIILYGNGVVGDGLRLSGYDTLINLTIRKFAGRELVTLGPGSKLQHVILLQT